MREREPEALAEGRLPRIGRGGPSGQRLDPGRDPGLGLRRLRPQQRLLAVEPAQHLLEHRVQRHGHAASAGAGAASPSGGAAITQGTLLPASIREGIEARRRTCLRRHGDQGEHLAGVAGH